MPVRAWPIRSVPASAIGSVSLLDREGPGDADRARGPRRSRVGWRSRRTPGCLDVPARERASGMNCSVARRRRFARGRPSAGALVHRVPSESVRPVRRPARIRRYPGGRADMTMYRLRRRAATTRPTRTTRRRAGATATVRTPSLAVIEREIPCRRARRQLRWSTCSGRSPTASSRRSTGSPTTRGWRQRCPAGGRSGWDGRRRDRPLPACSPNRIIDLGAIPEEAMAPFVAGARRLPCDDVTIDLARGAGQGVCRRRSRGGLLSGDRRVRGSVDPRA